MQPQILIKPDYFESKCGVIIGVDIFFTIGIDGQIEKRQFLMCYVYRI